MNIDTFERALREAVPPDQRDKVRKRWYRDLAFFERCEGRLGTDEVMGIIERAREAS